MSLAKARETSAGGVVFVNDEVLVLRTATNTWVMPKGHIGPDESAEQAAVREVQEETGLLPRVVGWLGPTSYLVRPAGQHISVEKTVHWFLMEADAGELALEPIFVEAAFVPVDEAFRRLTFANDRGILQRAIYERNKRRRSPVSRTG